VESLKSPRFILGLFAVAALTVLACFQVLGGDAAAAGILGLAGGTFVAKVGQPK